MNDQRQISWPQEALNSLSGGFALLMRDEQGINHFNLTADGFWRSFSAIALVLPIYLFADSTDWSAAVEGGVKAKEFSAIKTTTSLVTQWVVWPVLALYLTKALACSKNYARYITVFNWTTVLAVVIMAVPSCLLAMSFTNPQAGLFLSFMLMFITLYFEWYITTKALGTPMGLSAAIVAADLAVSLTINSILG